MEDDIFSCGCTNTSFSRQTQGRQGSYFLKGLRYFHGKEQRSLHFFSKTRFRVDKFMIDILLSVIIGFFLFPVFIVLALLLFISTGGNPFFLQFRIGRDGKLFRIIKFKTMNEKRDLQGNLLSDEQRLTKIGDILRKTSLDELPQLLNVIKGDMSLIGPRPWIPEQMEGIFTHHERACRCRVKPGITGLAQVYGRNGLTFRERFSYDLWYIRHQSLSVDLMILWRTVGKVLRCDGILQRKDAMVKGVSSFPDSEKK